MSSVWLPKRPARQLGVRRIDVTLRPCSRLSETRRVGCLDRWHTHAAGCTKVSGVGHLRAGSKQHQPPTPRWLLMHDVAVLWQQDFDRIRAARPSAWGWLIRRRLVVLPSWAAVLSRHLIALVFFHWIILDSGLLLAPSGVRRAVLAHEQIGRAH